MRLSAVAPRVAAPQIRLDGTEGQHACCASVTADERNSVGKRSTEALEVIGRESLKSIVSNTVGRMAHVRPACVLALAAVSVGIVATLAESWFGKVFCGWFSLSLSWLSLVYATGSPCWLGKRPGGRMPGWSRWLLAPWLVLQDLVWRCSLPWTLPISRVDERVWLGPRLGPPQECLLSERQVMAILDLTSEFAEPQSLRSGRAYLCLPVLDATAPTSAQLAQAVAWIRERRAPVYIHCAQGHGRSAMVAAAWLLASGQAGDVDDALRILRSVRPRVRLHRGQLRALRDWFFSADPAPCEQGAMLQCASSQLSPTPASTSSGTLSSAAADMRRSISGR